MAWGLVLGLLASLLVVAACSTPERIATPSVSGAPGAGVSVAPSASAPHQDATLEGRVVGLDGNALAGVPISVVKTNTGFQVGRVLEAVVTFGLSCVANPDDCPFRNDEVVDSAVTDATGHYALTLPDAYLPGYETDADWVASIGRPPHPGEATGPSSSEELEVDTAIQAAPDLTLWDTAPRVATSGGQVTVVVVGAQSMRGLTGTGADAGAVQFTTATGQNVWQVVGPVDARVLEDAALRVIVTGHTDLTIRHPEGRTIYHERLQTASVPFQGTAIPLSRGKACTLDQTPAVGCPLTDGDLVTGTAHQAGPVGTLDLGAVSPLGMVVVRGTEPVDGLTLDTSTNGTRWTRLTTGPLRGASGVVATPAKAVGRYLRLTSTSSGELREVSVWPPLAHPLEGGGPSSRPNPSAGPEVVVLLGVLVVVAAGGGVLVMRRRRPHPADP